MENKTHACYNCRYYKPYFICANVHYQKLDYGLCRRNGETKEIRDKHYICDNYSGHFLFDRIDKSLAVKKLAEAADSINIIAQILQNDKEKY